MKVSEIMTRHVECINIDTSVKDAAERMKSLDIGFLPICENDRLTGTITDRDITIRVVADGMNPRSVKARDVMTPNAFYCLEDQDIEEVGRRMQETEVKRMLILNRDHKLVGVVSLGDLSRASGEQQLAGETLKQISEAA
ncbi:MAG TPA: CBS domain-containing protein [Terriglobia bacterium]|nr:CBS domain-containing protein [Terriglobia bacterium]